MSLCEDIEGPIIKLNNGSVMKINSWEKAKKFKQELKEVLFLGDFLVNYGEFFNRGKNFQKPGYCEDWYSAELEKIKEKIDAEDEKIKEKIDAEDELLSKEKIKGRGDLNEELKDLAEKIIKDWRTKVSIEEAVKLSEGLGIALYPKYIFYWDQISKEEFFALLDWISHSQVRENKLVMPYNKTEQERFSKGKRALELIGAEHEVAIENVVLYEEETKALFLNLGLSGENLEKEIEEQAKKINAEKVLEIINQLSRFKIKDKSGSWVGARMGRPEKAKLRKLTGSPHVLFPVGEEGGRMRSVQEALEVGSVKADFPIYYCGTCKQETIYPICEVCNNKTEKLNYCPECQQKFTREKCPQHNLSQEFNSRRVDIKHYFDAAIKQLGLEKNQIPLLIKGVRGTSSAEHTSENLAKGILRAKHKLNVNKDGTIRYDVTEMPLTHFKPKEISVSIEKLKELGYTKDIYGKELENEEQLIEIMPQDVILPCCPESKDEKADEVFVNISNYIDEMLVRFYKQKPFYQVKNREDLIGHLVLGLAPHTSAGIVGRIIGFSKVQAGVAHPMWHAAQRRDCVDFDSYLQIKQNGNWKNLKIGELVEKLNPKRVVDSYGTKEKKVKGFKTIGFDGSKLIEVNIKSFTRHTKMMMIEIITLSGKNIKVTENHKFLVDGILKQASNLKVGDSLLVTKEEKIGCKDFMKDPIVLIKNIGEKESYCLNVDTKNHLVVINNIITKNCEGDETCIILLLDVFLNFSRAYLPSHRGSTQDAPLVATSILIPTEIDDMAFDIDVLWKYPLELYEAAEQEKFSRDIKITQLKSRLGTDEAYFNFGFTHNVDDFNNAVRCSAYKSIPTMQEKVAGQMWIAEKLRSVNTGDVARLVIDKHFIRDIKGNLRKFSQQEFRCVKCNEKYRRPPLAGKCLKCGGRIIFTISEGGIIKYLEPALSLANNYDVPAYVKQNLELTKSYIESIFGKETEKQEALRKWF